MRPEAASRGERGERALKGGGERGADRPQGASRTRGRLGNRQPWRPQG